MDRRPRARSRRARSTRPSAGSGRGRGAAACRPRRPDGPWSRSWRELAQHEGELARDVLCLRLRPDIARQNVPGVGLDLEMRREALAAQGPEHTDEIVTGRCERAEVAQEHRHVAVDPPLALGLAALEGAERVGQIGKAAELAVAHHDLMQIDAGVEALQRVQMVAGDARHAHSGGELDLRDRDAGRDQSPQRRHGVLELDRPVAHIVADAKVTAERRLGLAAGKAGTPTEARQRVRREEPTLEERDGFRDGLEKAARFGLERERDGAAGLALDRNEVGGASDELLDDALYGA